MSQRTVEYPTADGHVTIDLWVVCAVESSKALRDHTAIHLDGGMILTVKAGYSQVRNDWLAFQESQGAQEPPELDSEPL